MLKVTPGTTADIAEMADLLNPIIRAGGTTAYETEVTEAYLHAKFFEGDRLIALHIARDAHGLAGMQWINRNPDLPPKTSDIATFARLTPKTNGVGTALFPHTLEAARAEGCTHINATIRADNTGGLAYYTKMGFVDHEVARGVPLNDGTPVDRISKRFTL